MTKDTLSMEDKEELIMFFLCLDYLSILSYQFHCYVLQCIQMVFFRNVQTAYHHDFDLMDKTASIKNIKSTLSEELMNFGQNTSLESYANFWQLSLSIH